MSSPKDPRVIIKVGVDVDGAEVVRQHGHAQAVSPLRMRLSSVVFPAPTVFLVVLIFWFKVLFAGS